MKQVIEITLSTITAPPTSLWLSRSDVRAAWPRSKLTMPALPATRPVKRRSCPRCGVAGSLPRPETLCRGVSVRSGRRRGRMDDAAWCGRWRGHRAVRGLDARRCWRGRVAVAADWRRAEVAGSTARRSSCFVAGGRGPFVCEDVPMLWGCIVRMGRGGSILK